MMGRIFCYSPIRVTDAEIDLHPKLTKKYVFCQEFKSRVVPRFIQHRSDLQGKLALIRTYLLAVSSHGVEIRRSICKKVTCSKDCRFKTGMTPALNTIDTFLKLNDYESELWNVCVAKMKNSISTINMDEVLESFESYTEDYEYESDSESTLEEYYNNDYIIHGDRDQWVQSIDSSVFDASTWTHDFLRGWHNPAS